MAKKWQKMAKNGKKMAKKFKKVNFEKLCFRLYRIVDQNFSPVI